MDAHMASCPPGHAAAAGCHLRSPCDAGWGRLRLLGVPAHSDKPNNSTRQARDSLVSCIFPVARARLPRRRCHQRWAVLEVHVSQLIIARCTRSFPCSARQLEFSLKYTYYTCDYGFKDAYYGICTRIICTHLTTATLSPCMYTSTRAHV